MMDARLFGVGLIVGFGLGMAWGFGQGQRGGVAEEEPRDPAPAELEDDRRFEAFSALEDRLEPDVLRQQEILWQWWDAEPGIDAPPATWDAWLAEHPSVTIPALEWPRCPP